jgi:hypothetical protein
MISTAAGLPLRDACRVSLKQFATVAAYRMMEGNSAQVSSNGALHKKTSGAFSLNIWRRL